MEQAAITLATELKGFSIDLYTLQRKYCAEKNLYILHGEGAIQHIFSELYTVPDRIKKSYFKIKVLELLLFLEALEISANNEERPYFYKNTVEKIKAVQSYMTADLEKHHSLEN